MKTLKELQEKYPIGTKLNCRKMVRYQNLPYYSNNDLKTYEKKYGGYTILDERYCRIRLEEEYYEQVQGYLFNGEEWVPVRDTWDGWVEIHNELEEELKKLSIELNGEN